MRAQKRVVVFDKEEYDGEWPPGNAKECIAWFSNKIAEIPVTYMESARIELKSARGYEGEHYGRIEIYYDRPETDDEMAAREAEEQRRQQAQRAEELRMLAALKAKYGS